MFTWRCDTVTAFTHSSTLNSFISRPVNGSLNDSFACIFLSENIAGRCKQGLKLEHEWAEKSQLEWDLKQMARDTERRTFRIRNPALTEAGLG